MVKTLHISPIKALLYHYR